MNEPIVGIRKSDAVRVARAVIAVEKMGALASVAPSPMIHQNVKNIFPFGDSFAFGVCYAVTETGHLLSVAEGFVQSMESSMPVHIEKTIFNIKPLDQNTKHFHVVVQTDTEELAIIQSDSFTAFNNPSYFMNLTEETVSGFAVKSAVDNEDDANFVNFGLIKHIYSLTIEKGCITKIIRGDGSAGQRTDTDVTQDENIPEDIAVSKSLEVRSDITAWQLYGFDSDSQVEDGLYDLIESDPDTGEILPKGNFEQYELVVRVKGADGNTRAIGYMPIGEVVTPEDPNEPDYPCGEEPYPGSVMTDGEAPIYPDQDDPESFPGGISGIPDTDEADDEYPGKSNDCW